MEVHHLDLYSLKPNASYSCTVEAEGIGAGRPCHFVTNRKEAVAGGETRLTRFRTGYKRMASSLFLGGVLPLLLLAGCVGAVFLIRKYQSLQQRNDHLKKFQRFALQNSVQCNNRPIIEHFLSDSYGYEFSGFDN